VIYLDYAATSWPKPPAVIAAMAECLETAGGNPGRSGHRLSIAAARVLYDARETVAELFGAPDPEQVIFCSNATEGLNLAINGIVRAGDHVVTTGMEHNSVMRPLRALEHEGVRVTVVPCDGHGRLDTLALVDAVTPGTRLVVVNHASNVVGTIQPLAEVARVAHAAGALLLVDAAQTAGVVPIDVAELGIDLLAFTGHKGLHGPSGTGGLIIGESVDTTQMRPLVRGGTGSRSEYEEQPDVLPDRFESGTPNCVGLAGLAAGIRWVRERGIDAIRAHETGLCLRLAEGLAVIPGITLYGPSSCAERTAVLSCTVAGLRVSEVGLALDDGYGVLTRVGLHCSPSAHRTLRTFPDGTVRLALGPGTTSADVDATLSALATLAVHGGSEGRR